MYVPAESVGVYSSLVAGRAFEQEVTLLNSGWISPLMEPYVDEDIGKIVLECLYTNNQISPY